MRTGIFSSPISSVICPFPWISPVCWWGPCRFPTGSFLTGGLLGLMPQMIAHTVLGSAIFEPGSPAFIGSPAAMLLIGAVSLFFYAHELRKQPRD